MTFPKHSLIQGSLWLNIQVSPPCLLKGLIFSVHGNQQTDDHLYCCDVNDNLQYFAIFLLNQTISEGQLDKMMTQVIIPRFLIALRKVKNNGLSREQNRRVRNGHLRGDAPLGMEFFATGD